jgi:CRISPR/Cas system-associated exonuclease Cas4 (RecB family)
MAIAIEEVKPDKVDVSGGGDKVGGENSGNGFIEKKSARGDEKQEHISASQLNTYSMCSLKWLYSRKYVPEFVSSSLVFGGAFHAGLAYFHQRLLEGEECSLDELMAEYRREFELRSGSEIQYSKNESFESLLETAGRMYEVYLRDCVPGNVIAVEEKIEVFLHKDIPVLVGYIDLLEICKDDDGREYLEIVDFKTAGKKPVVDSVKPDQLLIYYHAIKSNGLLDQLGLPVRLRYDYITKTKTPEFIKVPVPYCEDSFNKLISKAQVLYKGMKDQICFPNPGWMCSGCGYQAKCAGWPEDV